jgi:hypothetical protein
MKTHLCHILPVWRACEILGEPLVERVVSSLLHLRHHTSANIKQDGPEEADLSEEISSLVNALFYRHPPPDRPDTPIPPTIAASWKRWLNLKYLSLDKPTLIHFLVPSVAQPHAGPAGHMGLFDCWVYALQGHSPSSTATYYGGASQQTVWIPDVLIMLAVCKQYADKRDLKRLKDIDSDEMNASATENEKSEARSEGNPGGNKKKTEDSENVIWVMSLLAYRIYDSYQKKGVVARDTVHRFLTDVYGEDSFKEPRAEALLDIMFDDKEHATGWLHATVSEPQFCRRVLDTIDPHLPYILLDWMATLMCNMLPPVEIRHQCKSTWKPSIVAQYLFVTCTVWPIIVFTKSSAAFTPWCKLVRL